jgi:predicted HD superfamily hydrolase involved in NAD metabolism
MAVQIYENNQTILNYCTNPIRIFPQIPLQERIKQYFLQENAVTEEILELVDEWLQHHFRNHNKRYLHSISTANTAEEIARIINYICPKKARLAGMLHDMAKTSCKKMANVSTEERFSNLHRNIENKGILLFESEKEYKEKKKARVKSLHAPIASLMAQAKLGIADTEVLNAIRFHTIGVKLDNLDTLSKIIVIADKIEPVKRGEEIYAEIMEVLKITKNPDIAINALKNRAKQAA